MFIAYKLSLDYHAYCLESTIEEEAGISRRAGDFGPLSLQYCLRILRNMCNAGQFSNLTENPGIQDVVTENKDGRNGNQSNSKRFADVAVVSRYGKDREIVRELEDLKALPVFSLTSISSPFCCDASRLAALAFCASSSDKGRAMEPPFFK
ncbi:hypothetical protein ACEPPN_005625 [Leptodophora sp. 'Broadleaf-Isolate-01']